MPLDDDLLAKDLRSFSESRRVAKEDAAEAAEHQRNRDNYLIKEADGAFAELSQEVKKRCERFNESADVAHRLAYTVTARSIQIRIGILEANLRYTPGRFADAFGPKLPVTELVLSRTSAHIGADSMPPGTTDYKAPPIESEQFRLKAIEKNALTWSAGETTRSATELAEYVVERLVQYYKAHAPR